MLTGRRNLEPHEQNCKVFPVFPVEGASKRFLSVDIASSGSLTAPKIRSTILAWICADNPPDNFSSLDPDMEYLGFLFRNRNKNEFGVDTFEFWVLGPSGFSSLKICCPAAAVAEGSADAES